MVALEHVKDALAMGGSILTIISNTLSIVKATYKAWRKPKRPRNLAAKDRDLELGVLFDDDAARSFGDATTAALQGVLEPIQQRISENNSEIENSVQQHKEETQTRLAALEANVGTTNDDFATLFKRVASLEMELLRRSSPITSRPGPRVLRRRPSMMLTTEERLRVLEE